MLVIRSRESQNARSAVIDEEDKHIVLDGRAQNFTTAGGRLVTHHHSHESLGIKFVLTIIECIMVVHIISIRVVKYFSRERVLFSCGDIIARHENDLVWVHSLLDKDLVCVESISLVPIVIISTAAGDDYGPVVTCLYRRGQLRCHHSAAEG